MLHRLSFSQRVTTGFVGCLRDFRSRNKRVGKWSRNNRGGVVPCSEKVEPGYFLGPEGGLILAHRKFRVGLDFDITMKIKARNVSGILLAIQGRRDYLHLQLHDGAMIFTVDNGRGHIAASFKPPDRYMFCDGEWHEIHGKAYHNSFRRFCLPWKKSSNFLPAYEQIRPMNESYAALATHRLRSQHDRDLG